MNTRYSDANDTDEYEASGEREITLSAATILGIFFLLALICAVFFGFGYTLGRKSAPSPTAETLASPAPVVVSTSKPAPGSRPVSLPTTVTVPTATTPPQDQVAQPSEAPDEAAPAPSQPIAVPATSPSQVAVPTRRVTPVIPPPAPVTTRPAAAAAAPSAATFVVQIAAVSHQEDAEVLHVALERRGYHINILRVPQDKLFHVQIGPFTTRKDADAMRQRLLNDGYNAIVK